VYTGQERIATLARQKPDEALVTLSKYLDEDWLRTAWEKTRKDGAPGIDGQTWKDFEVGLAERLTQLRDQAHSGSYQAPPVRRAYIPKGTGPETRPIGIPTLADKVLQRAVVMLLGPIYETLFHPGSYGFRPGRDQHQAINALRNWLVQHRGGWLVEVDVRKFFDTIDHAQLREFVRRRVGDGVVLRLIGKWLKAGVMEDEQVWYPSEGSPQGGVISPLLSNIFLHYVLDEWFETVLKPQLQGEAILIRFADDFVIACTHECDARALCAALPTRFAEHGLTIHDAKSRLVRFTHPDRDLTAPATFDLLGFTFHWGRTPTGYWTVKTKTAASRLRRALTTIADWCRRHRHDPIPGQQAQLRDKLRGHYAYYGRPGNYPSLNQFYRGVLRCWHQWLSRRSWVAYLSWDTFYALLFRHPLPSPKIHSGTALREPVVRGTG
jgi:RNA-directed DNA polymerase